MLRNNASSFDGKAWVNNHKWLLLILAVAFILRVAAAFILGNDISGLSGAHDEISYSMLGERFASGHGMTFPENWYPWIKADAPQSYYSYTMSLFLAGIYGVFGYHPLAARLIMAILSTLIVLMIYIISKRLFNQQVALLSAGIAAVYAYLIFYGVTLVTETPFILATKPSGPTTEVAIAASAFALTIKSCVLQCVTCNRACMTPKRLWHNVYKCQPKRFKKPPTTNCLTNFESCIPEARLSRQN